MLLLERMELLEGVEAHGDRSLERPVERVVQTRCRDGLAQEMLGLHGLRPGEKIRVDHNDAFHQPILAGYRPAETLSFQQAA